MSRTPSKKANKNAEPSERQKKKFYVVQVGKLNAEKKIEKAVSYPETTTTEKALKIAIAEHEHVVAVQITGEYNSATALIKAMQPKQA